MDTLARDQHKPSIEGWTPSSMPAWPVGLTVALLLLVIRFGALSQPPVWDGAMGMTPAAITLESVDFDISKVLSMPDYLGGGPNLHSLSIYTWFVALLIRLLGSYEMALPVLHAVSFGLAGLIAAGVFRAVQRVTMSRALGFASAAVATLFPPMMAQASDVYLDLPLATAVTWSFVYLFEDHHTPAIALASVAAAVKPSALIVIPAIAVYLFVKGRRRLRDFTPLLIPTAIGVAPVLIDSALQPEAGLDVTESLNTFGYSATFLLRMPVLLAIVGLLLFAALWLLHRLNSSPDSAHMRALVLTSVALPISFLYFFLLNPLVSKGVVALPRYTILFAPVVIIGLAVAVWGATSRRPALLTVLAVGVLFTLNMYGALEPTSSNAFWLSERSLAYEQHLSVQRNAFEAFIAKAQAMPAYYDHFAHYRIEYPEMGWFDGATLNGQNVNLDKSISGESLAELPDEFVMLIEGDFLGGDQLGHVEATARLDRRYRVESDVFADGEFVSRVVTIERVAQS